MHFLRMKRGLCNTWQSEKYDTDGTLLSLMTSPIVNGSAYLTSRPLRNCIKINERFMAAPPRRSAGVLQSTYYLETEQIGRE